MIARMAVAAGWPALFLESDDDLPLYPSMFDRLRAIALIPAKTKGLITDIMESLKEKPDPHMGPVPSRGPDDALRLWRAGRLAEAAHLVDEFGPFNVGVDGDPDFSLEAAILEAWGDQLMASNPAQARAVYLRAAGSQHAHAAGATAGGEGLARVAVAQRIRVKAARESLPSRQRVISRTGSAHCLP